jgi:hypothetical protein
MEDLEPEKLPPSWVRAIVAGKLSTKATAPQPIDYEKRKADWKAASVRQVWRHYMRVCVCV